jgi:hypothetical protein
MEWVLQVVDEIDDAIAIVRHGCSGLNTRVGLLLRWRHVAIPTVPPCVPVPPAGDASGL